MYRSHRNCQPTNTATATTSRYTRRRFHSFNDCINGLYIPKVRLNFRTRMLSSEDGSMLFRVSLMICLACELVCSQIQDVGETCSVDRYFVLFFFLASCSSAWRKIISMKDRSSSCSKTLPASVGSKKRFNASFSPAASFPSTSFWSFTTPFSK